MEELFTFSFAVIIMKIILIDIVLGGDNAIVIALAAGRLPKRLQNTAIIAGTVGAIGIRFIMAWAMLWLLKIPFLHVVGALLLIAIGVNLLRKKKEHAPSSSEEGPVVKKGGLLEAISTIMMADAIMSLDNVIGVVGVTGGNGWLVLTGMVISVPIIMYGSHFFIRMIEKYPLILYVGGGVLGWAAGGMIAADPFVPQLMPYGTVLSVASVAAVLGGAALINWRNGHVVRSAA